MWVVKLITEYCIGITSWYVFLELKEGWNNDLPYHFIIQVHRKKSPSSSSLASSSISTSPLASHHSTPSVSPLIPPSVITSYSLLVSPYLSSFSSLFKDPTNMQKYLGWVQKLLQMWKVRPLSAYFHQFPKIQLMCNIKIPWPDSKTASSVVR